MNKTPATGRFAEIKSISFSEMAGSRRILIVSEDPLAYCRTSSERKRQLCGSMVYCLDVLCDIFDSIYQNEQGTHFGFV